MLVQTIVVSPSVRLAVALCATHLVAAGLVWLVPIPMLGKGGVWFATLEEIAAHVRSCIAQGRYSPRVDRLPYYDGPVSVLGRGQQR